MYISIQILTLFIPVKIFLSSLLPPSFSYSCFRQPSSSYPALLLHLPLHSYHSLPLPTSLLAHTC